MAQGNKLYPLAIAFYLRGEDLQDLRAKVNRLNALLLPIALLVATFLFLRRVVSPQLRYISLPADYFALFLIAGIAISGVLMRYTVAKGDLLAVKQLALGLLRATHHAEAHQRASLVQHELRSRSRPVG